jgi:phage/conjugal plasmid C-4 type zinc finger TraR family protein
VAALAAVSCQRLAAAFMLIDVPLWWGGRWQERNMATGWAQDGAVQEQIDSSIEEAVQRARDRLPRGVGLSRCAACTTPIPEARRKAVPGVRLCVECQAEVDEQQAGFSGYNRRGSKDSQLR